MPPLPHPTSCPFCQSPTPSAVQPILKRLLTIADPARWDENPVAYALMQELTRLLQAARPEEDR